MNADQPPSPAQAHRHEKAGLYVHVPFCIRKCPYCDFYSIADLALRPVYLRALLLEIGMTADRHPDFDTLYIGGGTPSVLGAADIEKIVDGSLGSHSFSENPQITIEANPGTVRLQQLLDIRTAGVNRINIGIQSFQAAQLRFLGRAHSTDDAHQAIRWAREAGFTNLGMDLIYGLPGQTQESWLSDLQIAVGFQPEHLSCYSLTYESGTPMSRYREEGKLQPIGEAEQADLFAATVAYLRENGYVQYEVSNYERMDSKGKHSHRSKHNQKYWTYAPYLGLGPSAHSFFPPVRRWNVRDVGDYVQAVEAGRLPILEQEKLDRGQQMTEWIYLGLRQTDGIPVEPFNRRFEADFHRLFGATLRPLVEEGLAWADDRTCRLTTKGMLLLDSVVERFLGTDF